MVCRAFNFFMRPPFGKGIFSSVPGSGGCLAAPESPLSMGLYISDIICRYFRNFEQIFVLYKKLTAISIYIYKLSVYTDANAGGQHAAGPLYPPPWGGGWRQL